MNFNKDTLIGDILEQAPEKADILLEVGMHCLSCPASQQETLEEACEVHGIDADELVEKLNRYSVNINLWTFKFIYVIIKVSVK